MTHGLETGLALQRLTDEDGYLARKDLPNGLHIAVVPQITNFKLILSEPNALVILNGW